jgi:hypothetical protein
MEMQEQEENDGYREIFICEQDHPTMEQVTGRNFMDSPF